MFDFNCDVAQSYGVFSNDSEYEIVPINSHKNNTKIIRAANNLYGSSYTQYINDNMVSIKLKIVLTAIDEHNSPYLSNVKILFGKKKGCDV